MRHHLRSHFARQLYFASSLTMLAACAVLPLTVDSKASAPVLDGFGATTLVPSQANDAARRLFAQGVAQMYGFNEAEAIRAFKAALASDPDCGLCAWGVALQMGPIINNPTRGDLTVAKQYADYAIRHSKGASPRDQALIESLALRYGHSSAKAIAPLPGAVCRAPGSAGDEPADPLDSSYADYMRSLTARFPADSDVLALYAEAEMVVTTGEPWDPVSGKPSGRTGELATQLEAGLARDPNHVGLNHYMIHAVDDVRVAARAVAAADRLGKLAPKSPHLVHMPAHTFALVGRYADATRANQMANANDDAMDAELKRQNFSITKDWRGHNTHFQWYAAVMEGRGDLALATARAAAKRSRGEHEFSEYNRSLPMLTLLHFQRWDALLKEPMPRGGKGLAMVLGEMSRGIAQARSGQPANARGALARLEPAVAALRKKHRHKDWMGKMMSSLSATALAQLKAEVALMDGSADQAVKMQALAAEAAAHADRSEPPMLAGAPLQRLGEMQLKASSYAAAERTFRDALALRPANGWALSGLSKALAAQDKTADAQRTRRDLAVSWAAADSQLRTQQ
ncbi:hypothetical protein [Massilia eurypsychrophila]|nr:hypothetical protein [Massilia eurypsychrophila]